MDAQKKALLAEAGFEVTSTAEFLGLSRSEELLIEAQVVLTELLRQARRSAGWTQAQLAERLNTKQQVVARLEAGLGKVSLDAVLRALLECGLSLETIGDSIARAGHELQEERLMSSITESMLGIDLEAAAQSRDEAVAAKVPMSLIRGNGVWKPAREAAASSRRIWATRSAQAVWGRDAVGYADLQATG